MDGRQPSSRLIASNRHGEGLAIAPPEPDYLINHQDRDHKHEQPAIVSVVRA
jgi:hypothetical protein